MRFADSKDPKIRLAELSDSQREAASERYRVIQPFLEEGIPLKRITEESGKSLRTLRYWIALYRKGGLPSLVPKNRSDRGKRRMRTELKALAEAVWLRDSRRPVSSIHRQVVREAESRGFPVPSYDQVLAVVRSIDPSLATFAQEGTKAHKQKYDLLVRFEADRPNEIWQADHKHLKILLSAGKGKVKKPWLTAILDDHSRAVCGYYLGFEAPSSQRTALALRQAIWRKGEPDWPVCGIPERFYTDHGSDFESRRMEQVAADIRMRLDFSMVGEPRGRGKIERFFETVNDMFLCELDGFCPEGEAPPRAGLLTLPRLETLFREWLLGTYHRRTHGGTKQAPAERWEADAFVPRMPDTAERLDLLLLTETKSRCVGRDGIRFSNHRYVDLTLKPFVGENVVIRYDPRDIGEIRVYHEGVFLCRAVCADLAGGSYSYKEVKEMNARSRTLLREQQREIEEAAGELLALRNSSSPTNRKNDSEPVKAELHDDHEKFAKSRARDSSETPPPSLKSYRNE